MAGLSVASVARAARAAVEQLRRIVDALDPALLDGAAALELLSAFADGTKVCEAGQVLAARRIDETGAYRSGGHLSAAHLVAATAGTGLGRATAAVAIARRMCEQPEVEQAVRSGELSLDQAAVVAEAVAVDPRAATHLVASARTESLRSLQERARAVRDVACDDRVGRYQRQREARFARHWIDASCMQRGEWALPPDVGTAFVNVLECPRPIVAIARRTLPACGRPTRSASLTVSHASLWDAAPRVGPPSQGPTLSCSCPSTRCGVVTLRGRSSARCLASVGSPSRWCATRSRAQMRSSRRSWSTVRRSTRFGTSAGACRPPCGLLCSSSTRCATGRCLRGRGM